MYIHCCRCTVLCRNLYMRIVHLLYKEFFPTLCIKINIHFCGKYSVLRWIFLELSYRSRDLHELRARSSMRLISLPSLLIPTHYVVCSRRPLWGGGGLCFCWAVCALPHLIDELTVNWRQQRKKVYT